jgi:hypothetical protein
MSQPQKGFSGAPTNSQFNMVCPVAHGAGCSVRAAAFNGGSRIGGLKESLTECEILIFLSLARDHDIAVRDHQTGAFWRGRVDMPFPEHGFVWVITDLGERKLLSIALHTVWRPNTRQVCSRQRQESGNT